jgi:hypothetical protein
LSVERVQLDTAGQVELKLKAPWTDGTTHLVMSPLEFMQRLAALVPRPRLHLIRFNGVLAPSAKLRALLAPQGPDVAEGAAEAAVAGEAERQEAAGHRRQLLAGTACSQSTPTAAVDQPSARCRRTAVELGLELSVPAMNGRSPESASATLDVPIFMLPLTRNKSINESMEIRTTSSLASSLPDRAKWGRARDSNSSKMISSCTTPPLPPGSPQGAR